MFVQRETGLASRDVPGLSTAREGSRVFRGKRLVGLLMIMPTVVVLIGVTVYPFIFNLIYSFMNAHISNFNQPTWYGIQNYVNLFNDPNFWGSIVFSVIYVAGSLVLETVFGFGLALLVNRLTWGRRGWFPFLLTPMMIAPVMVGILYLENLDHLTGSIAYYIAHWFHVNSSLLSGVIGHIVVILIDTWEWTPFMFLLLYAGLQSLPPETMEAAVMDGASPVRVFWHVIVPLMRPVLAVAVIFRTLDLVRTFDQLYILKGGAAGFTTLSIYIYQTAFQAGNFGQASAITLILLILLTWFVRLLVRVMYGQQSTAQ
ncbi:MAG: sugar ABC transporter permease [Alicyclobacillus sp.]|nr:sugar ABC transporter permease [Alicyclobacillus sp.]